MATTSTRSRTARIWIVTAAALILAFFVVRMMTREKLPVHVATVAMGDLSKTESTNAKVEPAPESNFEAHAPFPGVVKAVYVHPGQQVRAGELLLAMDDSQAKARLADALSAVKTAQANYESALHGGTPVEQNSLAGNLANAKIERDQAQHDLDALKKLQATGAASAAEVAAAEQRLAADNSTLQVLEQRQQGGFGQAAVAQAKAGLDDAQAGYAAAQEAMRQAIVRAPFAGTVYSIPIAPSDYVQQGDRLLSMADLKKLQVHAYFDEPEIGDLAVGQLATIAWDARPDQRWRGKIVQLPSTIIPFGTRNVAEVLISIDDDGDGQLLPETNVRVTVTVASVSNVLVIPRDALSIEEGSTYVYRVVNGRLERDSVTVGKLNLTEVQIVSGLKAGDIVATGTTNGQPLSDGQHVEIVK